MIVKVMSDYLVLYVPQCPSCDGTLSKLAWQIVQGARMNVVLIGKEACSTGWHGTILVLASDEIDFEKMPDNFEDLREKQH